MRTVDPIGQAIEGVEPAIDRRLCPFLDLVDRVSAPLVVVSASCAVAVEGDRTAPWSRLRSRRSVASVVSSNVSFVLVQSVLHACEVGVQISEDRVEVGEQFGHLVDESVQLGGVSRTPVVVVVVVPGSACVAVVDSCWEVVSSVSDAASACPPAGPLALS